MVARSGGSCLEERIFFSLRNKAKMERERERKRERERSLKSSMNVLGMKSSGWKKKEKKKV